ncbi:MAG: hypothetical protein MRQ09_00525 [Candidatus Midichloria sp.]|nr:hypothetical protein [Candidatus Midichloria sp.]
MARTGGSKKNLEIPSDAAIELEISQCESYNASVICAFEEIYPKELALIPDLPPVLTVKGRIELLASINGLKIAEELASNLSSAWV